MKRLKQGGTGSEMITRYREYLEFLDKKLAKMFEAQKLLLNVKKDVHIAAVRVNILCLSLNISILCFIITDYPTI